MNLKYSFTFIVGIKKIIYLCKRKYSPILRVYGILNT